MEKLQLKNECSRAGDEFRQPAELLLSEPRINEDGNTTEKLKYHKSLGINSILTELLQAGGRTV
jgi:hypothetical protein